jgi:uncharacterized tellurite resistance protein B-like protein
MLEAIKKFFENSMGGSGSAEPQETPADERDLKLAACALLLEIAYADDEFTEDERDHLEQAVRRGFGIDQVEAEQLISLAEQERKQAVDLWQFTNLIAKSYTVGQKMVLAEMMWGLVYADGMLDSHEAYLMRKITHLLGLKPGFLAEARKRLGEVEDDGPTPVD